MLSWPTSGQWRLSQAVSAAPAGRQAKATCGAKSLRMAGHEGCSAIFDDCNLLKMKQNNNDTFVFPAMIMQGRINQSFLEWKKVEQ